MLRVECLRGAAIAAHARSLAHLRCTVFREWPYLYEGTADYEEKYLQVYFRCPSSLAILVWNGDRCVGASTFIPLLEATEEIQRPFRTAGMDCAAIGYFGESVLLPEFRGQGLGVKFFDLREAAARQLGLSVCVFSAVERSEGHSARPQNWVSNEAFWRRRGYRPAPALRTSMSWPDIGDTEETPKPMAFWMRNLPVST